MSTQTNFLQFGSGAPVLQTLDVPLSQFPTAVGTLLTGIRGNLITGFVDQANGSTLGVVYDRKTGVWTPIKYPAILEYQRVRSGHHADGLSPRRQL